MTRGTVAVAALSARIAAEQLHRTGWSCIALDLYGDVDTQRSAQQWLSIGEPAGQCFDPGAFGAALDALAQRRDLLGLIAGGGFEGQLGLLVQAEARLPLIGTAARDWQRLRDPRDFFATLQRLQLPHPPVRFEAPAVPAGWLVKHAGSSGGWGITPAGADAPAAPDVYWQLHRRDATPMSATFVANGDAAVVLGCNDQWVQPQGDHPFVFAGIIGPVPLADAVSRDVDAAVQALAREYHLCGLGSVDFLLDRNRIELLEVNPRPSYSAALYADADALGAHVRAWQHGELPPATSCRDPTLPVVHGERVVYARAPLELDDDNAALIAAWPQAHDLPRPGARFDTGEPICSLSACGGDVTQLRRELVDRSDALLDALEQRRVMRSAPLRREPT